MMHSSQPATRFHKYDRPVKSDKSKRQADLAFVFLFLFLFSLFHLIFPVVF